MLIFSRTRTSPPAKSANGSMTRAVVFGLLAHAVVLACSGPDTRRARAPFPGSAWLEDAAVSRGYVEPGDLAQFGCPSGWMAVEETAAALRGGHVSTTYVGTDAPQHDGSIACVAQREFALPEQARSTPPEANPRRAPLAPVWLSTDAEGITVGFRREVPADAAVYIARETPCGPRVIGVALGDLLKWLADPSWGPKRHFLGMTSGGCPEETAR